MTLTNTHTPPQEGKWPPQGKWTYEDYARLPDDGWRYEVMEGILYMAPAPSPPHQRASNTLATDLTVYVNTQQLGQIFTAPIDVILPERATPVQPDIIFIPKERLDIIADRAVEGPPDLIVEILSPGNWINDRRLKYTLYAAAGIQEYWIVDVDQQVIEVYGLQNGRYTILGRYAAGDTAASQVVSGFTISVSRVCGR